MNTPVVVDTFRKSPAHRVLVYNADRHFEGIVTPMDMVQAIAGRFGQGEDTEAKIAERTGITLDDDRDDRDDETVAGQVIETMGTLPKPGERALVFGWQVEVINPDSRRVDTLLVQNGAPPHLAGHAVGPQAAGPPDTRQDVQSGVRPLIRCCRCVKRRQPPMPTVRRWAEAVSGRSWVVRHKDGQPQGMGRMPEVAAP